MVGIIRLKYGIYFNFVIFIIYFYFFRLNFKFCKLGVCKRNCKGNLFCLNCIGERKWFGEINDDSWYDIEDFNNERR